MIDQEIYILTKHAKFQAEYIEYLPVYRRRHFFRLFEDELEKIEEMQEKTKSSSSIRARK